MKKHTNTQNKKNNLDGNHYMTAALAIAAASTSGSSSCSSCRQQIIPSAYAATATGGSAITEGACSTGSFADMLLASVASSCGPNFSDSAAGAMAFCKVATAVFQLESKAHARLVTNNEKTPSNTPLQ
jgi:hypothetical protein